MRTYRFLWLTAASLLGLIGTVAALAFLEGPSLAICGVLGVVAGSGWEITRARSGGREPRASDVAVKAGTGIIAVAAVVGLFSLLGDVAALSLLVLGATSPPVGRRYLGHVAARPSPRPPRASSTRADHQRAQRLHTDAASLARSMTDEQLCEAWCRTYPVLRSARTSAERGRLAAVRRAYLDEIERRDPEGFERWLDGGARASSDPIAYLRANREPPQPQP